MTINNINNYKTYLDREMLRFGFTIVRKSDFTITTLQELKNLNAYKIDNDTDPGYLIISKKEPTNDNTNS